jgi:hypothetical protein
MAEDDTVCAVCQSIASLATMMQPGTVQCPRGWTPEYTGFIMSATRSFTRSSYICVDGEAESVSHPPSATLPKYSSILSPVELLQEDGGTVPNKFTYREIQCAVCSQPRAPTLCKPLASPEAEGDTTGNVACTNGAAYGSVCKFACPSGYLVGGEHEVACAANGEWVSEPSLSKKWARGDFANLANGSGRVTGQLARPGSYTGVAFAAQNFTDASEDLVVRVLGAESRITLTTNLATAAAAATALQLGLRPVTITVDNVLTLTSKAIGASSTVEISSKSGERAKALLGITSGVFMAGNTTGAKLTGRTFSPHNFAMQPEELVLWLNGQEQSITLSSNIVDADTAAVAFLMAGLERTIVAKDGNNIVLQSVMEGPDTDIDISAKSGPHAMALFGMASGVVSNGRDIMPAVCMRPVSSEADAIYVIWGRDTCTDTTLYSGRMVGALKTDTGSGSNTLCISMGVGEPGDAAREGGGELTSIEYRLEGGAAQYGFGFGNVYALKEFEVPCAVNLPL